MIFLQLATFFAPSKKPKAELCEKFDRATSAISNSFTIKISVEDEQYFYMRYKKLKHDTGMSTFLSNIYR